MKKLFYLIAIITTPSLVFVSCNKFESKNLEETTESAKIEVVGTTQFLSNLSYLKPTLTKAGELTEEEAKIMIAPLLAESIKYLADNGYDCLEDFETLEDPRITWVAMGLAELDIDATETKTTVGGCVLQAIGLDAALEKGLAKKAVKKAIKKIAIKTVAKAIPYVGEVLIAADFVYCLVSD